MSTSLDDLIAQQQAAIDAKKNSTESGFCSLANVNSELASMQSNLSDLLVQKATTEAPFAGTSFMLQFASATNMPSLQTVNRDLSSAIIASGKVPAVIQIDGVNVQAVGSAVTMSAISPTDPVNAAETLNSLLVAKGATVDITRANQVVATNEVQRDKIIQTITTQQDVIAAFNGSLPPDEPPVDLTFGTTTYNDYEVTIPFTATDGATVKVDWSDGSSQETLTPGATSAVHTYASNGARTVTFVASKTGMTDTTKTVSIDVQVGQVVVTLSEPEVTGLNVSIPYTATDGSIVKVSWGDGGEFTEVSSSPATHDYSEGGTYEVTFTASKDNITDTKSTTVNPTSALAPRVAKMDMSQIKVNGSDVSVTANLNSDYVYSIDWDDMSPLEMVTKSPLTHTYPISGGLFNAILTADNGQSQTNTDIEINIEDKTPANTAPSFDSTIKNLGSAIEIKSYIQGSMPILVTVDYIDTKGIAQNTQLSIPDASGRSATYQLGVAAKIGSKFTITMTNDYGTISKSTTVGKTTDGIKILA